MLVIKQLPVFAEFTVWKKIVWMSMATSNCLITNILQNIFFCAQQKAVQEFGTTRE